MLPAIWLDECMQFTVRHAIEEPAVRTDILNRLRQFDSHPGIAFRGNHVGMDFTLWIFILGGENRAKQKNGCDLFEQTPHLTIMSPRSSVAGKIPSRGNPGQARFWFWIGYISGLAGLLPGLTVP